MSIQIVRDSAEFVDISLENSQDKEVSAENNIPLNVFQRGVNVALDNPVKSFTAVVAVALCPAAVAAASGASVSAAVAAEIGAAAVALAGFALSNGNKKEK